MQYWDKSTTPAAWITLLLGWTVMINILGIRWYGESEYIYSMTKVIALLGFIILGIVSASYYYLPPLPPWENKKDRTDKDAMACYSQLRRRSGPSLLWHAYLV